MNATELQAIHQAISLLQSVSDAHKPGFSDSRDNNCPVWLFTKLYLTREQKSEITTCELWTFFSEVVAAGDLKPLSKAAFDRELPGAMFRIFGAKKSDSIKRGQHTFRGFRHVAVRETALGENEPPL